MSCLRFSQLIFTSWRSLYESEILHICDLQVFIDSRLAFKLLWKKLKFESTWNLFLHEILSELLFPLGDVQWTENRFLLFSVRWWNTLIHNHVPMYLDCQRFLNCQVKVHKIILNDFFSCSVSRKLCFSIHDIVPTRLIFRYKE